MPKTKGVAEIRVKRIYEEPGSGDGFRILVDRLWPRGLSREKARIDLWLKDIAPSDALRKWYAHDPAKWAEFQSRYAAELAGKQELLKQLLTRAREGPVTMLFSSRELKLNNAVALREYLRTVSKALNKT